MRLTRVPNTAYGSVRNRSLNEIPLQRIPSSDEIFDSNHLFTKRKDRGVCTHARGPARVSALASVGRAPRTLAYLACESGVGLGFVKGIEEAQPDRGFCALKRGSE